MARTAELVERLGAPSALTAPSSSRLSSLLPGLVGAGDPSVEAANVEKKAKSCTVYESTARAQLRAVPKKKKKGKKQVPRGGVPPVETPTC